MECNECGEDGAERMELRYRSGATVVVYLCQPCAASRRHGEEVDDIAPTAA